MVANTWVASFDICIEAPGEHRATSSALQGLSATRIERKACPQAGSAQLFGDAPERAGEAHTARARAPQACTVAPPSVLAKVTSMQSLRAGAPLVRA